MLYAYNVSIISYFSYRPIPDNSSTGSEADSFNLEIKIQNNN